MSREAEFFAYLVEHYAAHCGRTAPDVLAQWRRLGIDDLIYGLYEVYHAERLENAYEDIDALAREATER